MSDAARKIPDFDLISAEMNQRNGFFGQLQGDQAGFLRISAILKEVAGIHLPPNEKNYALVASRLCRLIGDLGFHSYRQYAEYLGARHPKAIGDFVSALTTNTTHFFREGDHFEILRSLMPELTKKRNHELRFWCSASSTGQEPYSIAMTVADLIPAGVGFKFLATDIDTEVLSFAARGQYSDRDLESVPPELRKRFFSASGRVHASLGQMIRFAQFNLMTATYPFQHKFDVIFCRNVLIYFERDIAAKVIETLARSLRPGGYLFIGHSETGAVRTPLLTHYKAAVYQRVTVNGAKP